MRALSAFTLLSLATVPAWVAAQPAPQLEPDVQPPGAEPAPAPAPETPAPAPAPETHAPVAAPPARPCTNFEVTLKLGDNSRDEPCVLDPSFLPTEAKVLDEDERSQPDVVKALRALADMLEREGAWGEPVAARIRQELQRHREGEAVNMAFAEKSVPVERHEACQCAWVTAVQGGVDEACYRFAQPSGPLPACVGSRDFADWTAAARAWVLLDRVHAGLNELNKDDYPRVRQRLQEAKRKWDGLRKFGYFQYPWELAASQLDVRRKQFTACWADDLTCMGEEGLDPETVRYIIAHPSMGLGISYGRDAKEWDGAFMLSLELFGVLSYPNDFGAWYWGASLGAGLASNAFDDPRFGAFFHVTRYVHVGGLVSVVHSDTRWDPTIFIALDLAGWVGRGLAYAGVD